MAKEIVAMILAGGRGSRLYALTQKTAKPAVSFGGKYRIVDFPLSNCVNSNIDTVGIATQYQPQKLNEYIGNGQPWDLDRLYGGVHTLPPYEQAKGTDWYKGTANAIYQNISFIATLPVLVISPLDDWMEAHFYNYITVAAMLILYGMLFLVVESRRTAPHVTHLEQITYRDALIIGVWQMLAIIPGTSRSGATIVGGLLLGLSRACVAEFTFYLAIPVMAGASLLKVLKFAVSGVAITGTEVAVLAVGCVVAFVVSLAAIRFLMDYVKRHNFTFFGIYRIALGLVVLAVAVVSAMV